MQQSKLKMVIIRLSIKMELATLSVMVIGLFFLDIIYNCQVLDILICLICCKVLLKNQVKMYYGFSASKILSFWALHSERGRMACSFVPMQSPSGRPKPDSKS